MLEAMQEHSVTSGGQIRPLPSPFMVLATQNPIEQEGTYPLRRRNWTGSSSNCSSATATVGSSRRSSTGPHGTRTPGESVADGEKILWAQKLVRRVVIADMCRTMRFVGAATHRG
jgi:MoxR-like ATPase